MMYSPTSSHSPGGKEGAGIKKKRENEAPAPFLRFPFCMFAGARGEKKKRVWVSIHPPLITRRKWKGGGKEKNLPRKRGGGGKGGGRGRG